MTSGNLIKALTLGSSSCPFPPHYRCGERIRRGSTYSIHSSVPRPVDAPCACVLIQLGSSQFVTWQQDRPPRTKEMQIEPCEGKETAWGFGKRSMEKWCISWTLEKKNQFYLNVEICVGVSSVEMCGCVFHRPFRKESPASHPVEWCILFRINCTSALLMYWMIWVLYYPSLFAVLPNLTSFIWKLENCV